MDSHCNILEVNVVPYQLDIAVITQTFSELHRKSGEHIINLDFIEISEDVFKSIFYQTNSFSISSTVKSIPELLKLISFKGQNVNGHPFCLVDSIMENIEKDLGVSINMLSICSLINLNKEIISIKSLADLSITNISCSLSWSEILEVIRCEYDKTSCGSDPNIPDTALVILTISVIFVTPNEGIFPTIIRFNYKVRITLK